ncbi:tyrosine protein kinase [Geobacter pelophilus]|uniref:Tyrosine protein kinase n=1 Tax=Geoanaerobacter pelophilus TaxID=60036 RepID=A0AAW4L8L7_9BACT|nr:tyrosine protein kinase [Geoanaerobacter pelophilus]MBT0666195.1 tyrosine protein kinase [Geoanaerobacter pelophilus]
MATRLTFSLARPQNQEAVLVSADEALQLSAPIAEEFDEELPITASEITTEQEELPPLPAAEAVPVVRPKFGWVSPQYTVSRSVTLDPATLAANRCVAIDQQAPELDAYRVLRTQILQRTRQGGGNTIMVSSALPGEGKSITAINLALTFAREFQQTVLLVDCDLRRQSVHRYLGYESDCGVIDYLLNDQPVPELITWPGIEKLTIISGGRSLGESSELLGSARMKDLVDDMRLRYPERYVIFDLPALLDGADALAFAPLVDHIVLAVREGSTPIDDVKRSIEMLPQGKLLGLVMNRHQGPPIKKRK